MSKILEFKQPEIDYNDPANLDKRIDYVLHHPNLVKCETEYFTCYVWQATDGRYTVHVTKLGRPMASAFRSTRSFDNALEVYHRIESHIFANDRSYGELCCMLNGLVMSE